MSYPNQPPQGGYGTYNQPHYYSPTDSYTPPVEATPVDPPPPAKKRGPLWLGLLVLGAIAAVCVAGAFYAFSSDSDDGSASGGGGGSDTLPLEAAVDDCGLSSDPDVSVGDGGRSVSITRAGLPNGPDLPSVACVLQTVDVPDAVVARIENTRALDGTQTGEWDDYGASWTYHPDDGLNIVIEHR